ncbi:MAG: hypothetical protein QT11_C0001G0349 [archaeon GW2011_AR20]|nr:MAG: hypothetical protein QT11_C0001G0349 [archaeon GW2011_AR20]AQS28025.1 hypothetical protein [uncultured archaeon]AQS28517.1 hypothetical protein [uncultured archaeon]AQS28627.1 hypothetical protein [uncultured archaeon]MBS3160357.1 hypothetical protein [Candidatus Woesearchaeota archaeon]
MRINFEYSQIYDELLTYMSRNNYDNRQYLEMLRNTLEFEKNWRKNEKRIEKEIEKVSGLKLSKEVRCFIVKHLGYRAISYPLTIKFTRDFEYLTAVLVHELIHVMLNKNERVLTLVKKKFNFYQNDFKIHFPVLLIERKVIENLFGNKFFNNVLIKDDHNLELAYEWEKVNEVYDEFDTSIIKFLEKC